MGHFLFQFSNQEISHVRFRIHKNRIKIRSCLEYKVFYYFPFTLEYPVKGIRGGLAKNVSMCLLKKLHKNCLNK